MMIVVAMVGLLMALAMPNYRRYTQRAKFTELIHAVGLIKPLLHSVYISIMKSVNVVHLIKTVFQKILKIFLLQKVILLRFE